MKIAIKIIAFICIVATLLLLCNGALRFKYAEGIRQMNSFYEQEENSVDVLILGSSHAFMSFVPELLWKNHGYSSYVMASAVQPLWISYYYLEEALKTQSPKVIVLEAYRFQEQKDYLERQHVVKSLYGMKWSKTKIDAYRSMLPSKEENDDLALSDTPLEFLNYHSRYSELSEADFVENYASPAYEYHKGATIFDTVYSKKTTPDVGSFEVSPVPISEKTETYYRKLLELAAEHNIPVLTVLAPMPTTAECYSRMLTAKSIAEEYGQTFIDYNNHYEELCIDFSKDIADQYGHLNKSGAEKFTAAVGQYLSEHYEIPDRRGDAKYESWDLALKAYDRLYNHGNIPISASPAKYVDGCLENGDYDLIITWNQPAEATEEYLEKVKLTFDRLGIEFEDGVLRDGSWIVRNGKVIYENLTQESFKEPHQFDRLRDILVTYGTPDHAKWRARTEDSTLKEQVFYLVDDEGNAVASEGLVIYTYDTWLSNHLYTYVTRK